MVKIIIVSNAPTTLSVKLVRCINCNSKCYQNEGFVDKINGKIVCFCSNNCKEVSNLEYDSDWDIWEMHPPVSLLEEHTIMREKKIKAQEKRRRRLRGCEKLILTSDDWHPCVIVNESSYVRAKVFLDDDPLADSRYFCRICFWGDDDDGMEKDLHTNDLGEVEREYDRWQKWMLAQVLISKDSLKLLGFVQA